MDEPKREKGILIYYDKMQFWFQLLSNREIGLVLKAVYEYAVNGKEPNLRQKLLYPFSLGKEMADASRKKYQDECERTMYAAACSAAARNNEPKPDKEKFVKEYRKQQENKDEYGQHHELPDTVVKKKAKEEDVRMREEWEESRRKECLEKLENYGKTSGACAQQCSTDVS